jgi:hypothetical protein
MRNLTALLIAVVLSGCTTTESAMNSWKGHDESELVSSWGAPTASIDTRNGYRVLTWEDYWGQYGRNVCRKSFTVNGAGIITTWSYSGCAF